MPLALWGCVLAAVLTPDASLAGQASPSAELHPSLRACAGIARDAERLICYDRAIERLSAGGDPTGTVAPSAEDLFGAEGAARTARREADKREELASIRARVSSLRTRGDGTLLIGLENGQLWEQVSSDVTLVLAEGDDVVISRAALGTYRIATPGRRYARVRRVR